MSAPRLPDGFAVQLDRRVRAVGAAALLGGSPTRLLRLSPTARGLIDDSLPEGRVEVRDGASAELARALLDATVAHPRPAGGPSHRDVTVVVPVRDNLTGLRRLVMSLRGLTVVIVDDGSSTPVTDHDFPDAPCDIEIVRHDRSRGPAAARNTGLQRCRTDFVAFLDSDVEPRRGWLESLLGHFCDPAVALSAPRIVALGTDSASARSLLARYEAGRSALDLGEREAPVLPYSTVSYVPSAAIVCRRSAVERIGGFDESLASGEDVDLCWRLLEDGMRLRYEPIALVSHQHPHTLHRWLSRRAFYGTSAAPLSLRHPDKTAPVVISAWNLMAWLLLAVVPPVGVAAAAVAVAVSARRTARAMQGSGAGIGQAMWLAVRGLGGGGLQLSSALSRTYWPAALIAAVVSRRCRRAVLAASAVDAARAWFTRRTPPGAAIGPLGYTALSRLDAAAYGTGLWAGVIRERTLRPLIPSVKP